MKLIRILGLLVLLIPFASAQRNRFPPINFYGGDPTGNVCTMNSPILQSQTTGFLYVCNPISLVYQEVANSSGGAFVHLSGDAMTGALIAPVVNGVYSYCAASGMHCDGTTDDTSAFNALLLAVYNAGGGKIIGNPGKTSLIAGQITLPNDSGSVPKQQTIVFEGAGGQANGAWAPLTATGFTLKMTYNAPVAKILTLGQGKLEWSRTNFIDTASDCAPFVLTTNTTIDFHDNAFQGTAAGASACNDAFLLGGSSSTINGGTTSPFQGYGTSISRNFFSNIRRGGYLKTYANAIKFIDNTYSVTCGGPNTIAAIEIDGTGDSGGGVINGDVAQGNDIRGNLFEMSHYVYAVNLHNTIQNTFTANTFWDEGGAFTALYHNWGTKTGGNTSIGGSANGVNSSALVYDENGNMPVTVTFGGTVEAGELRFGAGNESTIISPVSAASDGDVLFDIRRSDNGSDPNPYARILGLTQGGGLTLTGTAASPAANFILTNGSKNTTFDHQSIVLNTGNYSIYPGTGTGNSIVIGRGYFQLNNIATASRASPSAVPPGASYWDTTLNQPIWDNTAESAYINAFGLVPRAFTGYQGTGLLLQTSTGATTTNDCVKFDANGNTVDAGIACGGGSAIANVQITTNTTVVPANDCSSVTATSMPGVLTTSTLDFTPTMDLSGITGWGVPSGGGLRFVYWPTANTANWYVCNYTSAPITPGASEVWNLSAK